MGGGKIDTLLVRFFFVVFFPFTFTPVSIFPLALFSNLSLSLPHCLCNNLLHLAISDQFHPLPFFSPIALLPDILRSSRDSLSVSFVITGHGKCSVLRGSAPDGANPYLTPHRSVLAGRAAAGFQA